MVKKYSGIRVLLFAVVLLLMFGCSDGSGGSSDSSSSGGGTTSQGGGGSSSLWSAIYGDVGAEEMEGVWNTSDGGYIVAGTSDSYSDGGDLDALVLKVDAGGNIEWARTYGGTGDDMAIGIQQTSDGGYIVAGWTESFGAGAGKADFWVFKLDSSGTVEWANRYGGTGIEQAWSVDITSDGYYIVAGGTTSFGAGGADYWVLKLDSSGNIVWQRAYGGTGDDAPGGTYNEYVARVLEDTDGDYVVASETNSFGSGGSDIWVLKLRSDNGSVIWEYAYGDTDDDSVWSFQEASDGGYILPGLMTRPGTTEADMWVLRLAKDGTITWQKIYGMDSYWDEALTVDATADGGAIIGGYFEKTDADWYFHLLRVDSSGNLSWAKQYKYGDLDWPNAIRTLNDGGYIVAGVTTTAQQDEELWLMRLDSSGTVGASCSYITDLTLDVQNTTTVSRTLTHATVTTPASVTPVNTAVTENDITITPDFLCTGS